MSTNQTKTKTETKGKWQKGTSGNPAGRPIGSRNQSSLFLEQLLEGEAETLMRKAIDKAKEGDSTALRLCIDRLYPPKRDRLVEFPLPEITSPSQLSSATGAILTAVSRGDLTPNEADTIVGMFHMHVKIMETEELARKIEELESLILLPAPKRRKTELQKALEEEFPPDPFAGEDPPINLTPPTQQQATNGSEASTTNEAPEATTASPAADVPSSNSINESSQSPSK